MMAAKNDITGDLIKSKITTNKQFQDNFDRIFRQAPQSLDAAYERKAMKEGLNNNPVFPENQLEEHSDNIKDKK